MINSDAQLNRAYERYVDRLHDAYYGQPEHYCGECDALVEWEGDKWEWHYECEECGHSMWFDCLP